MKICMIIEAWKPLWGGGQAHVLELSKALIKNHNASIDLYVMNLGGGNESYFGGKLKVIKVGKKGTFGIKDRLTWLNEVVDVASKNKYDIIHAHANLPGYAGKRLGKKLNVPVIYTVHGSGVKAMKAMYGFGLKPTIFSLIEKHVQTGVKYDKEISVDSSFLKQFNINKPIVIPNGVDCSKFDAIKVKKVKNKIIFVGRLHPQKGLKYLIEAMKGIDGELVIVGSGDEEKELKEMSKGLPIKFKGSLSGAKLIKEYKSSSLFVLPSVFEGQPLTLLEAWASKLPVVVTNVGGNKDFVKNGKNGWLVEAKNVNALHNAIKNALNNKKLSSIGLEGYKMVKSKYTWNKTAQKTYEVYEKCQELKLLLKQYLVERIF